ncbi:hypothetical protein BJV82DRAFT_382940 [Fennellomyces sp. T-0311]|nr:hypothetical protein BJV82DRAFT_382940 [Fennellomyces sp. T-0311]
MLVSFLIFSIGRFANIMVFLLDSFPENWIGRICSFDLPWPFGLTAITLYLIGISQTISETHSISGWLPPPVIVDMIGIIGIFLPFVLCVPMTIAAGVIAEKHLDKAEFLVRLAHGFWFLGAFSIGSGILYAAVRLVNILKKHHQRSRRTPEYASIQSGILKIQVMATSLVICLWVLSICVLLYSTVRDQLMSNSMAVTIISIPYILMAPITILCAEILVIFRLVFFEKYCFPLIL